MLGLTPELWSSCPPGQLRSIIHLHVFDSEAVVIPLRPMANRFSGCFVWAPAPFFVGLALFFCCCFAFSAGETQVWLGDLRVVFFVVFVGSGFVALIDLPTSRTFCHCTVYFQLTLM